jgi:hypothetical protein
LFKSLSAVVFMMVAGCASEPVVNDQITDSVTQTPSVVAPVDATTPSADVTVAVVPSTTCADGATPVDGVCPGATSTVDATGATVTTQQSVNH